MKRENKAELVAQITNLFNDGLITAEKRDSMIASLGVAKEKVSKPVPDPEKYGVSFKKGSRYFFKGMEWIEMNESERPEYCYFAVHYRDKNDDLPKLVIDFYTTRKLFGIIKRENDQYVLKRLMSFNGMSYKDVLQRLYDLTLLQRNYNSIQAGESISGKGADLIGENPVNQVLSKPVETSEPKVEAVETSEPSKSAKTKKSSKK